VFGVGLSELIFVEQRTYQNDDGEIRRFIGLWFTPRPAAAGLKMLARLRRRKKTMHGVDLYGRDLSLGLSNG
jgi:hypothetical protein